MDTANKDFLVIRGYVEALPMRPGKEGNAQVSIVTDAGASYTILPKGPGKELLMHVGAPVEARGTVTREDELLLLHVSSYQVEDGYDDAWYDER